ATLDNGRSYRGKFYQITGATSISSLNPLWEGYEPWWMDWGGDGYAYGGPDYVAHYTGRVLAILTDGKEDRMPCRLLLADAAAEMGCGCRGHSRLLIGSVFGADLPRH